MPIQPRSHSQRLKAKQGKTFKARRRDKTAVKVRNSHRWQKLRALVIRQQPICADPFKAHAKNNRIEPSEEVHHIEPIEEHPELAYVRSNLVGLCCWCHDKVDAMNRKGQPTRHFFTNATPDDLDCKNCKKGGGSDLKEGPTPHRSPSRAQNTG